MKEYFDLGMEELQSLGVWAAECARRSLLIYERAVPEDARPRKAIEGILEFSRTGKRTNALRRLAMDAYRASLGAKNEAAKAAAMAASLAAASAYTHPYSDLRQAEHILGPAAYSALAVELEGKGDEKIGDSEIDAAIVCANAEIARLLRKMPERGRGEKRLERLLHDLDVGIREKL
jgi:hypothetical protein